ncbi:MAG: TonB-dependent receptor plug domain-containing protein [Cytophagaceae bacterium]
MSLILIVAFPEKVQSQNKEIEVYELFDVSLEELLNVGIVSASKKKQSVLDAPATAYVITEEIIYTRGYRNLVDLLEDIPEIEIQKNSNPEFRNQITIRGVAGNEKVLILLNGIRITPATGDGYILGTQFSLANAQRVEVVLGPASALYGVDAFSGIINIITRSQEGTVKGAEVSSMGGNFTTFDNSFVGGLKVDKVNFSLTGHHYYSGEPNLSKYYPHEYRWHLQELGPNGRIMESPFYNQIYHMGTFERWAGSSFHGNSLSSEYAMPTFSYFINADITYENFTVGYVRHSERHSSAHGVDPQYTTRDGLANIHMIQDVFYARHNYTSFNKRWGLQTHLTQNFYKTDPESHFASAASRWQRGYIYSFGKSFKIEEQLNYDISSKATFIGGLSFENLSALPRTGLSPKPIDPNQPLELQNIYFIGAAGYESYITENEEPVFNDSLAINQNFYYLNYQNYGGFAQVQFTPVKILVATLGMRYDYNTRFGGSFNPRLGLVFSPVKKLRVKLLYGESFLAPSPRKAFEQSGAFYGYSSEYGLFADYYRIPNPDLKPEKLRSAEFSAGYFITPNLSLNVNAYYTQISDLINLYGVASRDLQPDNMYASRLETSINEGVSDIHGGTVRLNYLLKIGTFSFNTYGAYSYVNGDINYQPLLYMAKHSVKSGVDIVHHRFSISPRIIYRSPSNSNLRDGPNGEYFSNYSFMILNLGMRYELVSRETIKVSVFSRVNNLTNVRHYHVYSGNDEGMPLTPQDPARILAGINIKL